MQGTIRPCLKGQNKSDYNLYYCGLCIGMGRNTGLFSRIFVNYELSILYLISDSIQNEKSLKKSYCPVMPFKKVLYRDDSKLLKKLSLTNYLLAYYKVLDDVLDEKSALSIVMEKLMKSNFESIIRESPELGAIIELKIAEIHRMESEGKYIALKEASVPFGELMEGIMSGYFDDSVDSKLFAALSKYLGMWIYIVDACEDLQDDYVSGKYNPILAGLDKSASEVIEFRKSELTSLLMYLKNTMQELVLLFSFSKNQGLIDEIFEKLLTSKVAKLLM
jgi:hypothetical protein